MAERWQTGESRSAAVWVDDGSGSPATGLPCTATVQNKDGTVSLVSATVVEVGQGFYRVTLSPAPTKDVLVLVNTTQTGSAKWVPLEVPVGGYVDQVDTTVSSRSTPAQVATATAPLATTAQLGPLALEADVQAVRTAVTALGSPAQAAALTSLTAAVTGLGSPAQAAALTSLATAVTALGTPAQAAALTALATALGSPAQAAALTSLAAAVTALGTPAQAAALAALSATVGAPAQSGDTQVLLGRLTAARAALLDGLVLLDAAVSSRARPADVQVTVNPTPVTVSPTPVTVNPTPVTVLAQPTGRVS